MNNILVGTIYIRAELDDYILKNESMLIELDGNPHTISLVPSQKLKVVHIFNNIDMSNNIIDMEKLIHENKEEHIISHAFKKQVIVVEKV